MFVAIPYLICACILVPLIRAADTSRKLLSLSLAAPWLMGMVMLIFVAVIDPPELRSAHRLIQLADVIPTSAIVGYCYVALAWLAFFAAQKLSLIKPA